MNYFTLDDKKVYYIIETVKPVVETPPCLKNGLKQDCFNCKINCFTPKGMCIKPYPGYPNGCPNYGKKRGCPPYSAMFNDLYDMNSDFYAIITLFNLSEYANERRKIHPNWTEKALRNPRHWQNRNRKEHKYTIKLFNSMHPDLIVTNDIESMGVNVIKTLKELGLEMSFPVKDIVYRTSLAGTLKDGVLDKYNYQIEKGNHNQITLEMKCNK